MKQEQFILPKGVTVRGPAEERYVIEDLLGQGEMGAVYLVREVAFEKGLFALKEVINPDAQDRQRFAFEGQVLTYLHHRALPRVQHVFENEQLKRVYILMDYITGQNLETLRKKEPQERFPLPMTLLLMAPIVDALVYLHSNEPPILHRDIKPANVIIPVEADGAMLVDFGSAKVYVSGSIATIAARHSPGYAAPEQYASGTNPRTDIYGLGATLYTLLTGIVPIDSTLRFVKIWDERGDILKPANAFVPGLPESVTTALQRAMSISSADRFATVEEFWQALTADVDLDLYHIPRITSAKQPAPLLLTEKIVEQPVQTVIPPTPIEQQGQGISILSIALFLFAIVILAVIIIAVYALLQR